MSQAYPSNMQEWDMSDAVLAHRHSSRHFREIVYSERCGCFSCCAIFDPTEIKEWTDGGQTALCPECGIDSVIGSESGYPVTTEFLIAMMNMWF